MHLSDESLLAQVAQGDRTAFESLYDRYAARVLGFSLQLLGERAAAEELLQETFWQVWQRAATFPPQHLSFISWLFRIVRNLSAVAHSQPNDSHLGANQLMEENAILDPNLEATQIRNALRSLPQEQRQVIEMVYFRGMTRHEIANATGESLVTISGRARSALQKMQKAMKRDPEIE